MSEAAAAGAEKRDEQADRDAGGGSTPHEAGDVVQGAGRAPRARKNSDVGSGGGRSRPGRLHMIHESHLHITKHTLV